MRSQRTLWPIVSAPLHAEVTVYTDAGIFLYEAFQHTTLHRHQPLLQRTRQLTGTAYPQTSTATSGEARVDTRGTRTRPRVTISAKAFRFLCSTRLSEPQWTILLG